MAYKKTIGIACFTLDDKLIFIKKPATYNFNDYFDFILYIYHSKLPNGKINEYIEEYLSDMTSKELLRCLNITRLYKETKQKSRHTSLNRLLKDDDDFLNKIYEKHNINSIIRSVLLSKSYHNENVFQLPGGQPRNYKDKQEPEDITAIREFREETLIDPDRVKFINKISQYTFQSYSFNDKVYMHKYYVCASNIDSQTEMILNINYFSTITRNIESAGIKTFSRSDCENFRHQFRSNLLEIFDKYLLYKENSENIDTMPLTLTSCNIVPYNDGTSRKLAPCVTSYVENSLALSTHLKKLNNTHTNKRIAALVKLNASDIYANLTSAATTPQEEYATDDDIVI